MIVEQDDFRICVRRSLLWMAGSNLKSIEKLTQQKCFGADVVTMDLEDTVPVQHKAAARQNVREALQSLDFGRTERAVRVNSAGTGLMEDDVAAIVPGRPDFIRIPKVYEANEVWLLDRLMTRAEKDAGLEEGSIGIVVHIENPVALLACAALLGASPRVVGVVLSGEDYRESLQARRSAEPPAWEMLYGRGKVLVEARAAGVQAFDSVYMDTRNNKGYRAEAEVVRIMGFDGKNCLTGEQVAIANEVFSPSTEDIDFARRAVEAYDVAVAGTSREAEHGLTSGMLPYVDGTLIGPPVALVARRTLAVAGAVGLL